MDTQAIIDVLGDYAADYTAEQVDDLARVGTRIEGRFPADQLDDPAPAMEALSGAIMAACGDATVESLADELRRARAAAEVAYQRLAGALIWAQEHDGLSDYKLAEQTGQARNTVRKALGL